MHLTRKMSGKAPLVKAIRYALNRLLKPSPYLDYDFLELDNNTAELAVRPVTLGRNNYLLMDSKAGGKSATIAYTLIATCKLNKVNPKAWLLGRIQDHPAKRVNEWLPLAYQAMIDVKQAEAEAKNNAGSGAALMRTAERRSGKKRPVIQAFKLRWQTLPPHRHQQHHMLASYQIVQDLFEVLLERLLFCVSAPFESESNSK